MTVIDHADLAFAQLPGRRSADPLAHVDAASSVRVVHLEHAPGRRAHRHPRSEEIVYVASGRGAVWIDGVTTPVALGDVIHVPAGAAHATVPEPGTAMRLVCFFPDPDLRSNTRETDLLVDVEPDRPGATDRGPDPSAATDRKDAGP